MSASKFLHFGTALLLRDPTPPSPLLFHKSLRFLRFRSSVAVDPLTAGTIARTSSPHHQPHPWPEWITFVDRLKTKGYFVKLPPKVKQEAGADVGPVDAKSLYIDINLVKDACLSFARDRYDVFKSLSTKDIQTVVESGCPNLFKKSVNSAKRLRAFVRLDEGDVCSTCILRVSCDRAYVILKEAAYTVDIVRILLFYALDPLVILGGEKSPGRDIIESSARKLFSELIDLSEASPDPVLPMSAVKGTKQKEENVKFKDDFYIRLKKMFDKKIQDFIMKREDYTCPKCNFMNSRNIHCQEEGPKGVAAGDIEMKKEDWTCPECNFINISRNIIRLMCKSEGPKRVIAAEVEMKKGGWNCPRCAFLNYRSMVCLKCNWPQRTSNF